MGPSTSRERDYHMRAVKPKLTLSLTLALHLPGVLPLSPNPCRCLADLATGRICAGGLRCVGRLSGLREGQAASYLGSGLWRGMPGPWPYAPCSMADPSTNRNSNRNLTPIANPGTTPIASPRPRPGPDPDPMAMAMSLATAMSMSLATAMTMPVIHESS